MEPSAPSPRDLVRPIAQALGAFADLGATLIEHEDAFAGSLATWAPLTFSAWAARFGDLADRLGNQMTPSLAAWIAEGRRASGVEVQRAMAARTATFRQVQSWFEKIDLLVTPTLSRPALAIDHDVADPAPSPLRPRVLGVWHADEKRWSMAGALIVEEDGRTYRTALGATGRRVR